MNYSVKRPFGPPIYVSSLSDEFVTLLKTIAQQTRTTGNSIGNKLVGNIDNQYETVFFDNQANTFMDSITPFVFECVKEFDSTQNIFFNNSIKSNLTYHLGGGPWINFQGPGEFNPAHNHTGELSAVLYIDIPECIEQENVSSTNSTKPCAGRIDFIAGSDGFWWQSVYSHIPKTGDLLIFPAALKHVVYPFKSQVERISMSFNIYNINVS